MHARQNMSTATGTREDPWVLPTPPAPPSTRCTATRAPNPPALVCVVGKTTLAYQLRAIEDLHAMLLATGTGSRLGSADEQKPAAADTVEAWGRSESNPVGGFYRAQEGLRGRFGMYMPSVSAALPRGARGQSARKQPAMRAIP